MNIGDEKGTHTHYQYVYGYVYSVNHKQFCLPGAILDSVVMETSPSTVLELGTYCGYSAVRIARLLSPATRLITVEMNPEYVCVARQVIHHAGMQDKVRGQGSSLTLLKT